MWRDGWIAALTGVDCKLDSSSLLRRGVQGASMHHHRWIVLGFVLVIALSRSGPAWAGDVNDAIERGRQQGHSVRTISPIFSQLLVTGMPQGFVLAWEKALPQFYIREAVPKGE